MEVLEMPVFQTDADYFAHPAVSNSRLGKFRQSPMHYQHAIHNPGESTDAMVFGSYYHAFILEPDTVDGRYMVLDTNQRPESDKTMASNRNKMWKEQIMGEAIAAGKQVISAEWRDQARAMRRKLMEYPYIRQLLELPGEYEVASVFAVEVQPFRMRSAEPMTIMCKRKVDKRCPEAGMIIDLKTAANAAPEIREYYSHAWKFGYHRQGAMYVDGDLMPDCGFVQIVQEKSDPYAPAVYEQGSESLQKGRNHERDGYMTLLSQLAYCRLRYGDEFEWDAERNRPANPWPGYEFWTNDPTGTHELKVPFWV